MDDTQKDGSDSDWDSTLDFTSPRQPNFMPRMQQEIEDEESALSNESDIEEENIDVDIPARQAVSNQNNCKLFQRVKTHIPARQAVSNQNICKLFQRAKTLSQIQRGIPGIQFP